MPASDDYAKADEYQFHWLPFTVVYWIVAVVVAIAMEDAWMLFVFWLANPAVLAAFWLARVRVIPWLARSRR